MHNTNQTNLPSAEAINALVAEARKLVQQDAAQYLPKLGMALRSLGSWHHMQNQPQEAHVAFEEALDIFIKLAADDTATYRPLAASVLLELAKIHSNAYQLEQAHHYITPALDIYRQLVHHDASSYARPLADALVIFATIINSDERKQETQNAFAEALHIYRQLDDSSGANYLLYLSSALSNLGWLHIHDTDPQLAIGYCQDAVAVYRRMLQSEEYQHGPSQLGPLSASLEDLGILYGMHQRIPEAITTFEQAVQIRRQLAQQNPAHQMPKLASALFNLGYMHQVSSNYLQARIAYEEVANTLSTMVDQLPQLQADIDKARLAAQEMLEFAGGMDARA
ncbi:tetratricopeptide repeat protein [Undibacterium sp. JH2W]|uniref:tetratricopeptide repeat protein n=1 Tax=Undibacterium sp. JH2W TaxID=3413037 RepID=UPI003BF26801